MDKKYEMYEVTAEIFMSSSKVYKVRALRDFSDVKAGDSGGFIECEHNLSHEGNCWIYDNAQIFGNAQIYDNAQVTDSAMIFGYAQVYGNSKIAGVSHIFGEAQIYGNARVTGRARVCSGSHVCGDAYVSLDKYTYIDGNTKLNHGLWTQAIKIGGNQYFLLSTTLEKKLVENRFE